MAAQFNSIETKKEEFRQYLEKGGVIDALTKVLVGLYEEPEKPSNALEFVQSHLSTVGPQTADIESLKLENGDLKKQLEEAKAQIEDLKRQLEQKQETAASS